MIGKFLHTGFEVNDLEEAVKFYKKIGFTLEKQFDKPEPKAKVATVINTDRTTFELWQFIDKDHPQVQYICQHIAFETDDLDGDTKKLVEAGCGVVIPKTRGVTLTYTFVRDPSGNCIELGQR